MAITQICTLALLCLVSALYLLVIFPTHLQFQIIGVVATVIIFWHLYSVAQGFSIRDILKEMRKIITQNYSSGCSAWICFILSGIVISLSVSIFVLSIPYICVPFANDIDNQSICSIFKMVSVAMTIFSIMTLCDRLLVFIICKQHTHIGNTQTTFSFPTKIALLWYFTSAVVLQFVRVKSKFNESEGILGFLMKTNQLNTVSDIACNCL